MSAKKTAADDFDWSLESYDDPDYGEIKEWTYDTGKDEFTIQSYVDEDGIEHFDATSSVNGLLNDDFDGFDSFEEAENACYNAADRDDEKEADDPFATEASAKKAEWSTVDYSDYPGMEDVTDAQTMTDEANDDDYMLLQYSDGHVELEVNGDDAASYSSMDEAKQDVYNMILDNDGTVASKHQASAKKASEGWIPTGVEPYGSEYDDYSNGYAAIVQLNGSEYKDYGNGYAAVVRLFTANGDDYNVSFEIVDAETGETVYFDADADYYTFSEAKRAADAWVASNVNASKHKASVKKAHDVSNLDAAISALSDQLALDPDNELADMLADLVEYRNSEAEETVEDEIEAHGENVPITESAKTASITWNFSSDNGRDTYLAVAEDGSFIGIITEGGAGYEGKCLANFIIPEADPEIKSFDTLEEAKAYLEAYQPALF